VDAGKLNYRALTRPFDVFSFDFSNAMPTPAENELLIPAINNGTAGAVLFWFELRLDGSSWLSNAPAAPEQLHWRQGLQFLPEALVNSGAPLPLIAQHDGSELSFHWKKDALPKEALSALPRFDPRRWRQTQELEYQNRGLLQHCLHNPDEYRKVAQLAQRLAIDPAAHEIDPIIAQRFAAIFFRP